MTLILLLVENPSVRNTLQALLRHDDYHVDVAQSWASAERRRYGLVIASRHLLPTPLPDDWTIPVIFLARDPSIEDAIEAMREGAIDYFYRPFDVNRFLACVHRALEPGAACGEKSLPAGHPRRHHCVEAIVGPSPPMELLRRLIDKVGPTDSRILIQGANGTGKELVARWLHQKSARRASPFVEVNCAAIPGDLIESELFGHEKGSFTSADRMRRGKFEQADGGTLFLDEIGDMSLAAQAKVLRVLQERKVGRVGSDRQIAVDVRVIAATNKDLRIEIEQGRFREDLYHRLAVIVIRVPPLDEHLDDVPHLIDHFIGQVCAEQGLPLKSIDKQAVGELAKLRWRGNVRELRNVVERLVVLSGKRITAADVRAYVEPVIIA